MAIKHWPTEDRPREKLLNSGERSLTDAELLAIFLNAGVRGKSALDIAKELLAEYGSLQKMLSASKRCLLKKKGLGIAKYALLQAALELGRRAAIVSVSTGTRLDNTYVTQRFLASRLSDYDKEVFACLFLNHHLRLIRFEELFFGTINEINIYPREIVKRALHVNAAKIILAHNHPSGESLPSQTDKEVTLLIQKALCLVDIAVVDHIIVGRNSHFSFAEGGLLL